MKKGIVFIMSAVLAVSLGSFSFAEAQKAPAKPAAKTPAKTEAKAPAKPAAKAAPAPKTVVFVKGISLTRCRSKLTDSGTIEIVKGVIIPVKKGKFDLVLPSTYEIKKPLEGEEDLSKDLSFGDAKVVCINKGSFKNSAGGNTAGSVRLSFDIYYSDRDVKGTGYTDEEVSLKKGWNIIGDKKDAGAEFGCGG